jgi:hypothetical protein
MRMLAEAGMAAMLAEQEPPGGRTQRGLPRRHLQVDFLECGGGCQRGFMVGTVATLVNRIPGASVTQRGRGAPLPGGSERDSVTTRGVRGYGGDGGDAGFTGSRLVRRTSDTDSDVLQADSTECVTALCVDAVDGANAGASMDLLALHAASGRSKHQFQVI